MKARNFLFLTCLLLSACSIEKRLYRPGYNVNWKGDEPLTSVRHHQTVISKSATTVSNEHETSPGQLITAAECCVGPIIISRPVLSRSIKSKTRKLPLHLVSNPDTIVSTPVPKINKPVKRHNAYGIFSGLVAGFPVVVFAIVVFVDLVVAGSNSWFALVFLVPYLILFGPLMLGFGLYSMILFMKNKTYRFPWYAIPGILFGLIGSLGLVALIAAALLLLFILFTAL